MRVGKGYDVHRLVTGRKLVIGGVTIPFEKGLLGHSDADVLVHAVCGALLGAAGLGDIGRHFPDTDAAYKDICSLALLQACREKLENEGFSILNLDATVFAQVPKLAPYNARMRDTLARTLQVEPKQVNIKATTTEGLGFIGKGEGIAAECVVLIHHWQA